MTPLATRSDLSASGFVGFVTVRELTENPLLPPVEQGVYAVVAPENFTPIFIEPGTGGFFKNVDPNFPLSIVRENWVPNSDLLYLGKAGLGKDAKRGIRKRLKEYMQFGLGRKVGHKGGRLIWQIQQSAELLICWRPTKRNPLWVENEMLAQFKGSFGVLPYANLRL